MITSTLFLLWLLSSTALFSLRLLLCDGINIPNGVVCSEEEKRALLSFKRGLTDPSNRLSSWSVDQENCCRWTGVSCKNITGQVVELHLGNPYGDYSHDFESYRKHQLGGKITPSLLELQCLSYLDLSWNNFTGASVPSFLGSVGSLRYLNLSYAFFEPSILHHLGNLSSLRVLDLSFNYQFHVGKLSWISHLHDLEYLDISGIDLHNATDWHRAVSVLPSLVELLLSSCGLEGLISHQLGNLSSLRHLDLSDNFDLYVDDLGWIPRLRSLESLNMRSVDLHKAVDWLQAVSMLPSLSELYFSSCQLVKIIPPLSYENFTSLKVLHLSGNNFRSKIPDLLFNLTTSLLSLDLSYNLLYGHIPSIISNLRLLSNLELEYNHLTGKIPNEIGQLKHLECLSLSGNSLYGPIPTSVGNLSSLRMLELFENQLNGTLPKSVAFLSNLEELNVHHNSLAGIISEVNFAKLSKLKILSTSSNSLFFEVSSDWVPPFQLHELQMRSCKMGPGFPAWLQTQTSLYALDISQSGISGKAPEWFWKWVSGFEYINLSDNQINGDISNVLLNSSFIEMSSNSFGSQLPRLSPHVEMLNLANSSIFGPICPVLCQEITRESKLRVLDLSNNLLSGGISCCWMHFPYLVHVNLGRNNLSGKIPNSMGSLSALESLQLHNNKFFGKIALTLQNCTFLVLIDLSKNEFTGLIPTWIGEMTNLRVLQLRSNKFTGNIPAEICQLSQITVLDLGNNRLLGPLPKCLNNLSAMAIVRPSGVINTTLGDYYSSDVYYKEGLWVITKGRESEYKSILDLVRSIDLSSNNLSGSIQDEFSSLHALQFLNLSRNQITGKIPENIGGVTMLESLDLSRNHLLGKIPESMSNLTFLSFLDLSYNNFSGRIPTGTQLQSFNATSYIGNADLCGAPLNKNCLREEGQGVTPVEKEEDEHEMLWFYIGMGPGFAVGFWVVCGTLLLKKTWRNVYFQFVNDMKDRIYLAILLKVNWLRKKFKIKRSNDT